MRKLHKPNFRKIGRGMLKGLETGLEVVCFLAGVGLIAYGFWDWVRPLSFILPGALFVYIGLPSDNNAEPGA